LTGFSAPGGGALEIGGGLGTEATGAGDVVAEVVQQLGRLLLVLLAELLGEERDPDLLRLRAGGTPLVPADGSGKFL
jgi:hypothetical protein